MSARSVILKSKNWEEFNQNLFNLSDKEKGNAFELLTKYLFEVVPNYSNIYEQVWIHHELPEKVKKELNIWEDLGIDLIAKSSSGEYHAIQCKYHSNRYKNVSLKELSTFFTLYQSRPKLNLGYVCSSSNGFSGKIKKSISKPLQYILSDKWEFYIDEYMWAIHKYIKDKAFNIKPYIPRDHQLKALQEAKEHFKKESRGKLIFPCGAGKSLTGFWFTQELKSKNTLIAVPSLSLIKQTLDVYLREIVANKEDVKWLCICSDDGIGKDDDVVFKTENIGVPCQTDPEYIENWLKDNKISKKIVFTTYQSGKIIAGISKKLKLKFDIGIFDEAHKTVGSSNKLFSHLLFEENISIDKRIFMTATERFYGGKKSEDIISMDNQEIYGDTFSMMTFKEAIEAKPSLLTDYKVITIDVKQSEISEFIKENRNVEFSGDWDKDVKSRSLASMLALRKAMKLFPIKNAVSFHSSIKQAKINAELQDYISETYDYKPIDTFTVKGKDPTSLRSKIVKEFADSEKALITNARCLTEGIDVPNIDCIVFADPRRSKVDIVQALGRALRKKEGKDWGYVILPVIYDEKTNEIDNDNFNEILSVVRGLAANDERIVDYFKFKEIERIQKSKAGEKIFNFEVLSEYIDESELKDNLQIKLWEKLSKFQWMHFEDARDLIRKMNFKSSLEYISAWRNGLMPENIPAKPQVTYKNSGFISMPDFLGYINKYQEWMSFEKARLHVRSLKLKNTSQWKEYSKSNNKPINIPMNPRKVYKNEGWINMGDWLGTGRIADHLREYLEFDKARSIVRKMNFKSSSEYIDAWRKGLIPENIPAKPRNVYKNKGFISMPDFLGYSTRFQKWMPFEEAREYVRKMGFKTTPEFKNAKRKGLLLNNIPADPRRVYKNRGWISMGDWLGTGRIADHLREYLEFDQARKFVHNLKLKNFSEWKVYYRAGKLPNNIPTNPAKTYKNSGWIGIGDWLGNGSNRYTNYVDFIEAREFARKLGFSSSKQWSEFSKTVDKPNNIPASPSKVYSDKGWNGWPDFLDSRGRWREKKKVRSFDDAKNFALKMNIKSAKEWFTLFKERKIPNDLPSKPQIRYKDNWKGWADFLGKDKK